MTFRKIASLVLAVLMLCSVLCAQLSPYRVTDRKTS